MRKYTVIAVLIMLIGFSVSCTRSYNPAITSEDLLSDLNFLATDSLKGRYPGTPEDSVLLHYIADKFESYGLKPVGKDYIDYFEVLSAISPSDDNLLRYNDKTYVQGEDYMPLSYSSNDTVNRQVVFCGYGFEIKNDTLSRDDYAGRNVNGKWALIFKGEPENKAVFMEHSRDRDKILLAKDKGAAGVLFVSGKTFDPKDEFREEHSKEPSVGVPAIHIKREVADQIMKGSGFNTEKTEKETLAKGKAPVYESKAPLEGQIEMIRTYSRTGNVAAVLEGSDPQLKDQWVIMGAHEDHLGFGGPGSSSRRPDTIAIHYGADDNASGTASVLELAAYFSGMKEKPKRSMLFITFGAEEMGILGSRHFVENPPIDLSKVW